MTTYFTSDTHYNHKNIIEYCDRPFADVAEMNEALIENWNRVVQPGDTVYHLGDFAMGPGTNYEFVADILLRLRGHKIFVLGNHDDKTLARWSGNLAESDALNVEFIPGEVTRRIGGHEVTLCHFPFHGDSREKERYSDRRPEDRGQWLFHGHTHSHDVFSDHPRQLHVGVDSWEYTPVAETTLIEFMR